MDWLKGKRTYIIVGLFVLLSVLMQGLAVGIPQWVFGFLEALGLVTIRLAIQAISGNAGWRTYVAALVVGVIALADALGLAWLAPYYDMIYTVLGGLGIMGVRKAVETLKT